MSQNKGGGRGPEPDDKKNPANQKDETAVKPSQRSGDFPRQRWDVSQGSEPATRDSSGQR